MRQVTPCVNARTQIPGLFRLYSRGSQFKANAFQSRILFLRKHQEMLFTFAFAVHCLFFSLNKARFARPKRTPAQGERRVALCCISDFQSASHRGNATTASLCRLQIGDPADWKSALRMSSKL